MNDDKWKDVLARISENFEIKNQETRELREEEGLGEIEIVEFDGPLGRMRLERTTQPLVLDRKSIGSKRVYLLLRGISALCITIYHIILSG